MMRAWLGLAVALTVATPLAAQEDVCGVRVPKLPVAGGWVEYKTPQGNMKMAYLGKDAAGERIQMGISGGQQSMVMQVVATKFPYDASNMAEVIFQPAGRPAMRLPMQALGMMQSRLPQASQITEANCNRLTEVGKGSVTVGAGTFQATHYRDTDGSEFWVTTEIPFGLVKSVTKQGTMELVGHGKDAKSEIVGEPMDMPMPGGMGGRRPPTP